MTNYFLLFSLFISVFTLVLPIHKYLNTFKSDDKNGNYFVIIAIFAQSSMIDNRYSFHDTE